MKSLFAIVLIIIINTLNLLSSGQLEIQPDQPSEVGIIELNYNTDYRFSESDKLSAQIYTFKASDMSPIAYEVALKRDSSGKYKGSYKLPAGVIYGLIRIYSSGGLFDIFDNNEGNLWEFYVYSEKGTPIEKSLQFGALSRLGSLPSNVKRNIDYLNAEKLLEREAYLYPKNIQAQIGLTSLLFDMRKLTFNEFKSDISEIIKSDFDNKSENDIKAVSRALRALNQNDMADKLELDFAKENPTSSLAEELLLSNLSTAGSLNEFAEISEKFFRQFPNSLSRSKISSALVTAYLQSSKLNELLKLLNQMDMVSPDIYTQIMISLINNDDLLKNQSKENKIEAAINIYREYLSFIVESEIARNKVMNKPEYLAESEWKKDLRLNLGSSVEIAAEAYFLAGKTDSAYTLFVKAFEFQREESKQELFEKIIKLSMDKGLTNDVIYYIETSILLSKASNKIIAAYQKILESEKKLSIEQIEEKIGTLDNQANLIRLRLLYDRMINEGPIWGWFKTLDDKIIDFDDVKGNIAVINFWATWCGPCQVMLPPFEQLYYSYIDSDDVLIYSINIWEKNKDRYDVLKDFLEKKKYEFPIFYDEDDVLPRKIGISGLPSTVIIDKEGKIRFIELGFSNDEDFMLMINDIVELLRLNPDPTVYFKEINEIKLW